MENVKITFQTIPEGEKPPNGFQYINCHMAFDIKIEDFCRQECLAVGGHMTHTLNVITYSSEVIRETEYTALTMATLHDQQVKVADILNAHVMAPNRIKIWTVWGP